MKKDEIYVYKTKTVPSQIIGIKYRDDSGTHIRQNAKNPSTGKYETAASDSIMQVLGYENNGSAYYLPDGMTSRYRLIDKPTRQATVSAASATHSAKNVLCCLAAATVLSTGAEFALNRDDLPPARWFSSMFGKQKAGEDSNGIVNVDSNGNETIVPATQEPAATPAPETTKEPEKLIVRSIAVTDEMINAEVKEELAAYGLNNINPNAYAEVVKLFNNPHTMEVLSTYEDPVQRRFVIQSLISVGGYIEHMKQQPLYAKLASDGKIENAFPVQGFLYHCALNNHNDSNKLKRIFGGEVPNLAYLDAQLRLGTDYTRTYGMISTKTGFITPFGYEGYFNGKTAEVYDLGALLNAKIYSGTVSSKDTDAYIGQVYIIVTHSQGINGKSLVDIAKVKSGPYGEAALLTNIGNGKAAVMQQPLKADGYTINKGINLNVTQGENRSFLYDEDVPNNQPTCVDNTVTLLVQNASGNLEATRAEAKEIAANLLKANGKEAEANTLQSGDMSYVEALAIFAGDEEWAHYVNAAYGWERITFDTKPFSQVEEDVASILGVSRIYSDEEMMEFINTIVQFARDEASTVIFDGVAPTQSSGSPAGKGNNGNNGNNGGHKDGDVVKTHTEEEVDKNDLQGKELEEANNGEQTANEEVEGNNVDIEKVSNETGEKIQTAGQSGGDPKTEAETIADDLTVQGVNPDINSIEQGIQKVKDGEDHAAEIRSNYDENGERVVPEDTPAPNVDDTVNKYNDLINAGQGTDEVVLPDGYDYQNTKNSSFNPNHTVTVAKGETPNSRLVYAPIYGPNGETKGITLVETQEYAPTYGTSGETKGMTLAKTFDGFKGKNG